MKKKSLTLIGGLAVILVVLNILTLLSASTAKTSGDNIEKVTAPNQESAMENEEFTIAVYEPPTIDGTNVALGGLCEATSFTDVYPATNANDGTRDAGSY